MRQMDSNNHMIFRKHFLGFTIIQHDHQKFASDSGHIFFNGQKLLSTPTIEELKGIKAKKINSLKRNARDGENLLQSLNLKTDTLIVNPRYEECYFNSVERNCCSDQ